MSTSFTIAANQGSMGGGEVMLFAIAEAARTLGRDVTVVAPQAPGDVAEEARRRGFRTVAIEGRGAAAYLRGLRSWDRRHRRGLMWCNGLRPAVATAGHPTRVVELHQRPEGALKALARVAMWRTERVVVPSASMATAVPEARVMWNWTDGVEAQRGLRDPNKSFIVGFLGRLSSDKGVVVLCHAMAELETRHPGRFRLLLAGESRFVASADAALVSGAVERLGGLAEQRGWVDREEFFRDIDLAVFPSVWAEPFGLVVAEAMSAKVPFVVSDAGALSEVAGDAWVAQAGSATDLADVIEQAAQDPDRYIEASRQRWVQLFSAPAGLARLKALLDDIEPQSATKVALVHDYLTQRGGAERVALALAQAFPEAELVTSLYDPEGTYPEFGSVAIRTSFLNRVGFFRRHFRAALPLFPIAFSTLRVDDAADVVLVSTTGFAHGIRTDKPKVVYCHSPARFLYLVDDYLGGPWWKSPTGWALMALRPALTWWDKRAAHSADVYLCNSTVVRDRIRRVYGLDATVVPPPAVLDPNDSQEPLESLPAEVVAGSRPLHLVVSRLMPYKNVDAVIEAFRGMPERHLLIIGRGPLADDLRRDLPGNVTMAEGVSDAQLRWAYAHAAAVIAPSWEDFGLTPVEGFAFGTPALALRAGGYLDTVVEGENGWFFDEASPAAIRAAVARLEQEPLDSGPIQSHARRYSVAAFTRAIQLALAGDLS